ncbi:hypothetical protein V8C42DRAFT_85739 [Trichoderma barbatum]
MKGIQCCPKKSSSQRRDKGGYSETVDGMFLLAKIYLTLLQDKMTVNDIRRHLAISKSQTQGERDDQKVKTLAYAYQQAIERVQSQGEGLKNLAMRALAWIIFSKSALATQDGMQTLDHDDVPDLNDICHVCVGLTTVDERRGIV